MLEYKDTAARPVEPKPQLSSSWSRRNGVRKAAAAIFRSLSFSIRQRDNAGNAPDSSGGSGVARRVATSERDRSRIPQPKLVHYPSKMEVRTAPATPSCSPAVASVSDYRSHFNTPSTSGGGPASSISSTTSTTVSYPASRHSSSNGTSSSTSTESIPICPQAAVAAASVHSPSPQNGFHPSTATVNGSVNGYSVGTESTVEPNGSASPQVNGSGGTEAQRQASITILSSKGTESLKEMVQCPICLDRLHRPKMLPCQHTFCFLCLQNSVMSADASRLRCAKCRAEVPLPKEGISGFPSSIHLQNILDLLESDYASMDELLQCCGCQTVSGSSVFCEHCKLTYCSLCMARHVEELAKQLGHIADQLDATVDKITQRYKKFESSQSEVQATLREEAEKRVRKIRDLEAQLLHRLEAAKAAEETGLNEVVQKVRTAATGARLFASKGFDHAQDPNEKIRVFMKLHRDAGDALSEVTTVGNTQVDFDPEAFAVTVECRTDAVLEDEAEPPGSPSASQETISPASSPASAPNPSPPATDTSNQSKAELQRLAADAQSRLYRSKSFLARMRLGNGLMQRPSGVAVSPWSSEIFVVSMDNHKVFTFDSTTGKFLRSFGSRGQQEGEFLCPFGIALSQIDQEILITDKWKHCIHVFDRDGNFRRQIGMKGRSAGHFRSPESICVDNAGRIYVCDTCNHRIQVLDHDGIFLREIGTHAQPENAFNRSRSMFQEPTGVAVSADGQRVVVCDFGSHRVHVFSSAGEHLTTFGQKGALKGHFMHPECVAVDGRGFILVGDSGNGRVQICRPDGRHVRTFGNKGSSSGQFSWISGIAVTPQNEVVVCDFKNHSVQVF
ncbi:hypothetical protein V5799_017377 [Amblyomma americanum]|uniref:RING-type domain-containing protein n=1 Tax=Amblyomma americanum TaxID=6943 RepID=A0AAQ4F2E7_AMBAM